MALDETDETDDLSTSPHNFIYKRIDVGWN